VSSNPIALVSALPQELELLREAASQRDELDLGLPSIRAWAGHLDGHDVVLAECGIGKVSAAMLATALILTARPRLIVFTGVAGGLQPGLHIGDVVIGDVLFQHDFGTLEPNGIQTYQPGHLPFLNPTEESGFRPPPALLMAALRRVRGLDLESVNGHAPEIVNGNILTGDVFVNSATHRMLLAGWGGKAVEMEGAALAQVAHEFGVPCLVVRALSDLAGAAAPSPELFAQFVEVASANSARVVRHLLPVLAEYGE
jgi:adenosylhomocysteine nucleosidase